MAKFDHFNLISPIYDLIFGRRKDHTMVRLADLNPDQTLLDVGGGTGRVSVLFSEISQRLVILDSSYNMLFEAKNKGLKTVNSHSERMPFEEGVFDRIILVDALHHVADQYGTLKEMWRLLAPNGKMIIEEPDINHFLVKLIALGEKFLLMRSNFLAPKKIVSMCRFDENATINIQKEGGIAWIIIEKINYGRG